MARRSMPDRRSESSPVTRRTTRAAVAARRRDGAKGLGTTFTVETRGDYPGLAAKFDEHEQYGRDYEARFRDRYAFEGEPGNLTLRDKVVIAALSALGRARLLTWDVTSSINNTMEPAMLLSTRAHFEMAGFVASLVKQLDAFYNDPVTTETAVKLDDALHQLHGGTRFKFSTHPRAEQIRPEALNVLTLIKAVGYVLSKDVEAAFRDQYEWLSEFCHPDALARLVGHDLDLASGVVHFSREARLPEEYVATALNSLAVSHPVFFHSFDRAVGRVGGLPPAAGGEAA